MAGRGDAPEDVRPLPVPVDRCLDVRPKGEAVDPHQQFVVRVRDERGNDVTDYRLEFHVEDTEIRSSSWQDDNEIARKLQADGRQPYIGMNVGAVPRGQGLTYDTDRLRYFPVDIPLLTDGNRSITFFKESTSTPVDVSLQGVQGPQVIRLL